MHKSKEDNTVIWRFNWIWVQFLGKTFLGPALLFPLLCVMKPQGLFVPLEMLRAMSVDGCVSLISVLLKLYFLMVVVSIHYFI